MRLITKKMEVEVEVEEVKVKGRYLTTSERSEIRQKSFVVVTRKTVDADTEEESTVEKTVFSDSLYNKAVWVEMITSLDENAVNEEGERLECNEENLGVIFDYNEMFALVVVKKLNAAFAEIRNGEIKN